MRVSEALSLQREDVDWVRSLLLVRHTKYRKSRYVPLSPTALQALDQYATLRNRRIPMPDDPAFLLFDNGRAISGAQARYAFAWIRCRLTWDPSRRRPRLYDLRHTFACRRLQAWYQEGRDVNSLLPLLTTYLGHTKVSDTYWYLTGTEALLSVAAGRFERLVQHSTGEPS